MKRISALCILAAAVMLLHAWDSAAQDLNPPRKISFAERNLGGPRLGVTFIPGGSELSRTLKENGIESVISQFGWHFEWQIIPEGGGPQFVVQFVPLVAGVEYGKLLLSTTLGLGIRMPSGIEFGIGPNLLFQGKSANPALMVAIGKSFDYSGVSIPINLVAVRNPDGFRLGLIIGYSIAD